MTLTYEDCKELKYAGFPQREPTLTKFTQGIGESAYFPTLSELIEACGDRFLELYRNPVDKVWSAMSNNRHEYTGKGYSPEQAVKNLWIALNTYENN